MALLPFGLPFTITHAFCDLISMTLARAGADSTSSQAAAFRQVPACSMPDKASGSYQSHMEGPLAQNRCAAKASMQFSEPGEQSCETYGELGLNGLRP